MKQVRGNSKKTSIKRRRQHTGSVVESATKVKDGRYAKAKNHATGFDVSVGTTDRKNVTTIETTDTFTIHAASESLCTTMIGCNGQEFIKRRFQLDKHCKGWKMVKHKNGIVELKNVPITFRPSWIERKRVMIASKHNGNSGHVTDPTPALHNYRAGKQNPENLYAPPEFYGSHNAKRLNTGSKNGSRERQVNDLPTVNEIGRNEAESDGIENYPMPIGGHLETERKLYAAKQEDDGILEDVHSKHLASIGVMED